MSGFQGATPAGKTAGRGLGQCGAAVQVVPGGREGGKGGHTEGSTALGGLRGCQGPARGHECRVTSLLDLRGPSSWPLHLPGPVSVLTRF